MINELTWDGYKAFPKPRVSVVVSLFLLAVLFVNLVVFAQVKMAPIEVKEVVLEPSGGVSQIPFRFNIRDTDPLAADGNRPLLRCFLIQNLGSATAPDEIESISITMNGVTFASELEIGTPPVIPPTGADCPEGASNSDVSSFDAYVAVKEEKRIPDEGEAGGEKGVDFELNVTVANSGSLGSDSQNHTVRLRVLVVTQETLSDQTAPESTQFESTITDPSPDVVWNGGINHFKKFHFTPSPISAGSHGKVAWFQICDEDANQENLKISDITLMQGPLGSALASDIEEFRIYKLNGSEMEIGYLQDPSPDFERGGGGVSLLNAPNGQVNSNAIVTELEGCADFKIDAHIRSSAVRSRTIHLNVSFEFSEPDPIEIGFSAQFNQIVMIGNGVIRIAEVDISNAEGSEAFVPIQLENFSSEGFGGLSAQTSSVQFDPSVISILGVEDVQSDSWDFEVDYEVDSRSGLLSFSLNLSNPEDVQTESFQSEAPINIANIVVTPKGKPGDSSPLILQYDQVFDLQLQEITRGITAVSGSVNLLMGGDIDGDGMPTVRDALKLATVIVLECQDQSNSIGGLSDDQKRIADVVKPFESDAPTDCQYLTSADVKEIARLAINEGIEPSGAQASAQRARPDAPWWASLFRSLTGWLRPEPQATVGLHLAPELNELSVSIAGKNAWTGLQGRIRFDPSQVTVRSIEARQGFQLAASSIDNVTGEIRFVALNLDGGSQATMPVALRYEGHPATANFRVAPSMVLDRHGNEVPFVVSATGGSVGQGEQLRVDALRMAPQGDGWALRVEGAGVHQVHLAVYDLAGSLRSEVASDGTALRWTPLDAQGRALANGVYLYAVTVEGADGTTWRSPIRKLAVLR